TSTSLRLKRKPSGSHPPNSSCSIRGWPRWSHVATRRLPAFTDMGPAWRTNCGRARAGLLMARVFCDSSLHPARGERRPDHGDRMANCRQPPQRAQVHRSPFRRGQETASRNAYRHGLTLSIGSLMLLTGVYLSCPNPATPWRRCRHKSLTEPLKPSDGCCQNWASWTDTSTSLLRGEIELNLVETSTIFGCRWQNEANFSRSVQWLENRANFWLTQSPRIRARVGGSSTLPGVAYVEPPSPWKPHQGRSI